MQDQRLLDVVRRFALLKTALMAVCMRDRARLVCDAFTLACPIAELGESKISHYLYKGEKWAAITTMMVSNPITGGCAQLCSTKPSHPSSVHLASRRSAYLCRPTTCTPLRVVATCL